MFKKVAIMMGIVLCICLTPLFAQTTAPVKIYKVAVLPFENTTADYLDTSSLAEMLQAELVGKTAFIIVERDKMDKVLDEQYLALSGMISEDRATEIGEMMGAENIISGTVSFWEDKYVLTVKNIRVGTGEVIFGDTVSAWSISGIAEVMPQLAQRLANLAQGKKVTAFKIKKKPVTPEERAANPAGKVIIFRENIYNNPNKNNYYISFGPGIAVGSALGFPKSVMVGPMGRFKAPGETFFQLGLDLQVDIGKISDTAGITRVTGFPFVAFNIFNNGFLALTPFTGFFFGGSFIRESGSLLNTPLNIYTLSEGGWHIGVEGGIYLGQKTILKLNWKAGIPFSYASENKTALETLLPGLLEHNGIPLQNVNFFIEFLR